MCRGELAHNFIYRFGKHIVLLAVQLPGALPCLLITGPTTHPIYKNTVYSFKPVLLYNIRLDGDDIKAF